VVKIQILLNKNRVATRQLYFVILNFKNYYDFCYNNLLLFTNYYTGS